MISQEKFDELKSKHSTWKSIKLRDRREFSYDQKKGIIVFFDNKKQPKVKGRNFCCSRGYAKHLLDVQIKEQQRKLAFMAVVDNFVNRLSERLEARGFERIV